MRQVLAFLLLLAAAVVHALSTKGSRLLAIIEDEEDQKTYSKLFVDFRCKLA